MTSDQHSERTIEVDTATLRASFLRSIPRQFQAAAEKLELDLVLEAHLKQTSTPLGKLALAKELIPTLDRQKIITSLTEIDELRVLIALGDMPSFSGVSDIRTILHKVELEGSTIYHDEGLPLVQTLKALRLLRDFFAKRTKQTPTIWKSAIHLFEDRIVELAFEAVFDENGNVRDNASSQLHSIRREIVATSERLRTKLALLMKKYNEDDLLQEQIITLREGRTVIPVKAENKRRVSGMIHSVSQTGQTIYIEPTETIDLNNEMRSLEFAEQREIDRILRELTDRLRESVKPLLYSLEVVGHLEAIYAKARYANSIFATTPTLVQQHSPSELKLDLKEARHPFLIAKLGKDKTIPFTISLDDAKHTLVLTGPNAGGKTVLLKTTGLLLLLVHSGLPISAAEGSVIPSIDGLYVDIGDSQSIADDLSTFSSHIRSLKNILQQTNEYSVVLLDEIGSGTAPEEGGALAESILEHLTKFAGFTIATTHYGRLAAFAEAVEGAINGSMEFDQASLTPTYKFRPGVPGSSHAFEIAERYELPKKIISRAKELAGGKSNRLEDLINSLAAKEQDMEVRRAESEKELGKARFERLEYERQRDEISAERKKILSQTSRQAEELLSKANSLIEKAIREAREAAAPVQQANVDLAELRTKQKQDLKKLTEEIEEQTGAVIVKEQPNLEVKVGAKVKLLSNPGQSGEVLVINGKDAEVLFGTMKMKMKLSLLEVVSNAEARKEERKQPTKTGSYYDEMFKPKIDLRGKYGDEGVIEVEKFLYDANARGLTKIEILHGTGTGALGRRIHDYLRSSPIVATFRFGERHEGGMGVTLVELK
jgi:DNA mismatch repair protein MutS2